MINTVPVLVLVAMLWGMLLGWAFTVSVTQFCNPWHGRHRR